MISLLVHFLNIIQAHLFILPLISVSPCYSVSLISQCILVLHQNSTPVSPMSEPPLVLSAFFHCVCNSIPL